MSLFWLILTLCASDLVRRADLLYEKTDYKGSLAVLKNDPAPESLLLAGKNYFMLGEYRRAIDVLQRAPKSSTVEMWLGRAYGRRAETESWMYAVSNASKARQCFEAAVAMDPHNHEAMNDLFDYYLNAPGVLGGGMDKAEALARRIVTERPPEYHFEMAQLAIHRKLYADAEAHLRTALALAPDQVGRVLDLAKFLARQGRIAESDALFTRAEQIRPDDPRVIFARARSYVEGKRNLDDARQLLQRYATLDLTPDDPPRAAAEKLLRRIAAE